MSRAVTVRYPLEPLAEALGVTVGALSRRLRITGRAWQEARRVGVSEFIADRLAVESGLHPFVVWPDMVDASIADAGRPCKECGTPFLSERTTRLYCSELCRRRVNQRDWARRRYARDPEFVERQLQRSARYYEECGEYVRAAERRRYHERKAAQLAEAS